MIVCFAFSFSPRADAQQYLEVNGGPSFPIGDYGQAGRGGPGSYANVGRVFGLHYGRLLMEYAGIGAEVSYSRHSVDQSEATKDLGLLSFRQGPFTDLFMGVGAAFDFPVANRLNVGGRSMLGFMNIYMSEREIQYMDGFAEILEDQSSLSYALKLGAALRYEISEHVSVSLTIDMTDGNPTFKEGEREKVRRNHTYLNLGSGLIYYFGERTKKTAH